MFAKNIVQALLSSAPVFISASEITYSVGWGVKLYSLTHSCVHYIL